MLTVGRVASPTGLHARIRLALMFVGTRLIDTLLGKMGSSTLRQISKSSVISHKDLNKQASHPGPNIPMHIAQRTRDD